MALPGECVRDKSTTCTDCGTHLELEVLHSSAGYYLGFFCPNCGPYSRETPYYKNEDVAQSRLNTDMIEWR